MSVTPTSPLPDRSSSESAPPSERAYEVDLGIHFDDPELYLGDIDSVYARLRHEAPVYWEGRNRLWALSKHADVQHVSRTPQLFCSRRGTLVSDGLRNQDAPPPSIIYMDPPQHSRYRKLVSKAFTLRMVTNLEPRIRQITRESLDAIHPGEVVDFVESVAIPLPMMVIAEILGVPGEDRADFKRWSDAAISGADVGSVPETMVVMAELYGYFEKKLAERREKPTEDLVTALALAELDGERLSDFDLLAFCLTLLVAGNETTRNLISGGAWALIENPDERRKLARDPSLVPNAVEEMLRWVTPVRFFARTAVEDTEIRGQKIAAGDYLLQLYGSANRDEDVWGPTADRFDVARSPDPLQLAFGFGEHMCLGAQLARLEARVMFEELLARFLDFEAAGPVTRLRSTLINGVVRMPVVFSE